MDVLRHVSILFLIVGIFIVGYFYTKSTPQTPVILQEGAIEVAQDTVPQDNQKLPEVSDEQEIQDMQSTSEAEGLPQKEELKTVASVRWPVSGSAPTENVPYIVPLEEIKQGCSHQDCIPSVDDPIFVKPDELNGILDPLSIGISLSYKGEDRFYPFPMLETHELVNDTVAGDPILISYCPLCGTGIVFSRTLDGKAVEFGVSGMLWQSNLLMYNRADSLADRNLWSQVLGQAVVGERSGEKLTIIPSDIMRYGTWEETHPNGQVLTTGTPRDPYGGNYYGVAQRFGPNFDPSNSVLEPDAYVFGVSVNDMFKAYPRDDLPSGTIRDMIDGEEITITNTNGVVVFTDGQGVIIPDVEGFWFSWIAAHPKSTIYTN